jgi:hypothetical protein
LPNQPDETDVPNTYNAHASDDKSLEAVMHVEAVFASRSVTEITSNVASAASGNFFSGLGSLFERFFQPKACGLTFCGTIVSEELRVGEEIIIKTKERQYKGRVLCFESFGHEDKKAMKKGAPVAAVFRCDRPHPDLSTFKDCVLYKATPECLKDASQLFTSVTSDASR